jgi:HSP20 family molecular chaperone IbpA
MFKKKTCKKCGEKTNNKFNFCPNCGNYFSGKNEENWGMLGKDDFVPEQDPFSNSLFGGISGKMLNKMIGSTMKMLEKELKKEMASQPQKTNIQPNFELYINGKKIAPENIKITKRPPQKNSAQKPSTIKSYLKHFNSKNSEKFSKLPKKEPSTNVRRLSDKVVYEIKIPGVKSIEDVSIVKLENSIEIKAIAKDKAYQKLIPIDLPLRRYKLNKDKLVLELGVKE